MIGLDLENKRTEIVTAVKDLQAAVDCITDLPRYLKNYEKMFERFCPHQIGDRIVLSKEIDFEASHGWRHCQHFLKVGAVGTVMDRDFSDGYFFFMVHWDDESYKAQFSGVLEPVPEEERKLYMMYETRIAPYHDFIYPFFW